MGKKNSCTKTQKGSYHYSYCLSRMYDPLQSSSLFRLIINLSDSFWLVTQSMCTSEMRSRNIAYLVELENRRWSENESALYCTSKSMTYFPSFLFCTVLWTVEFQNCSAWMEVGLCSHSSWCSATHSSKSLHVNKHSPYQQAIAWTQRAKPAEQAWMTSGRTCPTTF